MLYHVVLNMDYAQVQGIPREFSSLSTFSARSWWKQSRCAHHGGGLQGFVEAAEGLQHLQLLGFHLAGVGRFSDTWKSVQVTFATKKAALFVAENSIAGDFLDFRGEND